MEAGYDYTLLRRRFQRRLLSSTGIFLLVFGALLLSAGGAYYGYAAKARADLDQLTVTLPDGTATGPDLGLAGPPPEPVRKSEPAGDAGPIPVKAVDPPPGIPASVIATQQLYPGESLGAWSWSNPWAYEPRDLQERRLLREFAPVSPDQVAAVGSLSESTRIMVPALGIDSRTEELAIQDLGDSRAYETPKNVVGHIPESANGGEAGGSWFFGHLESPIMGEGSVFRDLPRIPKMLRNGENVYVITDNGERRFLYRVTATEVAHQDDLALYDTGRATIHLVSCVPRLVYDYRLVISGDLIGVN